MPQGDFDSVGLITGWLDACRTGQIDVLLDLHDDSATLVCTCEGRAIHGRAELDRYWRPKLADQVTTAFVMNDLVSDGDSVYLDFQNHQGHAVRARFRFNELGKIRQLTCGPTA